MNAISAKNSVVKVAVNIGGDYWDIKGAEKVMEGKVQFLNFSIYKVVVRGANGLWDNKVRRVKL